MKVARPILQPMIDIPLPKDEVFASMKDLLLDLGGTRDILADNKTTSVRLVLNLEKMVIKEAQRAYTYLNLYDYQTDAVIVNRVLPADGEGRFLAGWRKSQQQIRIPGRDFVWVDPDPARADVRAGGGGAGDAVAAR